MNQPKAIIPLFFTEMWERFGYYAIQGLLVLYLIYHLNYTDADAFITLGEFLSWIYIAPIFGGILADQIVGYRYCILIGALLLCLGYLLLAFSGGFFLHLSLAIIVVGNGLLKPNNASFLGKFYYHEDPRRYPGFTFFYIGINIGGLFSIVISSFASQYLSYKLAFAIAGIGLFVGAIVFTLGFRYYENRGLPLDRKRMRSPMLPALANRFTLIILLLISILLINMLLHSAHLSELLLILVAVLVLMSLFYIQNSYNKTTRNKLIAIIILTAASVIYWALQLQIFFSLMLFTDRMVNRSLFHFTVPAPLFIILEPIFILILGPILARWWTYLSEQHREPTPVTKFAWGLIMIGIAMAFLAFSVYIEPLHTLINPIIMVVFYFLLTISELLISPTGLAMISELAPPKLTGFMMGVWYMVIGLGGLLAGALASIVLKAFEHEYYHHILGPFSHGFAIYAGLGLLVGIFLFLIAPHLKRLIHSQPDRFRL